MNIQTEKLQKEKQQCKLKICKGKAIEATKPKNKINFQVYSIFENHSLKINCVVGSKSELFNCPFPMNK